MPIVILCVIPISWLQWLLLTYATVNSIAFMLVNLWAEFSRYQDSKRYITLGFVVSF